MQISRKYINKIDKYNILNKNLIVFGTFMVSTISHPHREPQLSLFLTDKNNQIVD